MYVCMSGSCEDPLGSGMGNTDTRLTSYKLWILQFYALLVKRVHYYKGTPIALGFQNILPLLVILPSLLLARNLQTIPDAPALELSPHLFFAKSRYNYLFAGGYYTNTTASQIDSLFQPCGVAAHMLGDEQSKCVDSGQRNPCPDYPQEQFSCSCPGCELNESIFFDQIPPCYNNSFTGSEVLNLSLPFDPLDPNSGYYSLHEYLLRSEQSFIERRYGGVSFGHMKQDVDASVDDINADPVSTLPFLATHSAAKVWFSYKGYHAMPAYLNTMNNAILRGSLSPHSHKAEYDEMITLS